MAIAKKKTAVKKTTSKSDMYGWCVPGDYSTRDFGDDTYTSEAATKKDIEEYLSEYGSAEVVEVWKRVKVYKVKQAKVLLEEVK